MSQIFQFKQFSVDQSGCAMKINTDGVLLGASVTAEAPGTILDIGTGTGVIALMLAQKFPGAAVDAVEVDETAAQTAFINFKGSPFSARLTLYPVGFESYFEQYPDRKCDLIVSNPPFYINSLESPKADKTLAKHTDTDFFERLVTQTAGHLTIKGQFWLIVPVNIADVVVQFALAKNMFLQRQADVRSYSHSENHRSILCFGFTEQSPRMSNLTIYAEKGVYTDDYQSLLQPYFLNF